jgi:hypothetical protein
METESPLPFLTGAGGRADTDIYKRGIGVNIYKYSERNETSRLKKNG